MTRSASTAVPVTILTGFLGAGKTTLLNRILNGGHGLRVAVLVNDFGAINIDAELIVGVQDDVVSLANGCVCCTIRDDLVAAVAQTINRPEAPEYILLEASGVADPSSVAMPFVDPELEERIRLDSVTCVIDADQVFGHPENPAVEQLLLRQIGFSDMVVLNKVDLVGPQKLHEIREWLASAFRRLRVIEADHCDAPLEILLSVGRFDLARSDFDRRARERAHGAAPHGPDRRRDHTHLETFSTWTYETDRPLSLDALRDAARKLPGNIYRCKGIVYASGAPERPAVLQVVGRRVNISTQDQWGQRIPRTRIVAIGAAGSIEADVLEQTFASCIAA